MSDDIMILCPSEAAYIYNYTWEIEQTENYGSALSLAKVNSCSKGEQHLLQHLHEMSWGY